MNTMLMFTVHSSKKGQIGIITLTVSPVLTIFVQNFKV